MESYVIWSFKHGQWWGPDRCGYTSDLSMAGRYSGRDAGEITTDDVMCNNVAMLLSIATRRGAPTVAGLWED